jgi:hypothetical protein
MPTNLALDDSLIEEAVEAGNQHDDYDPKRFRGRKAP